MTDLEFKILLFGLTVLFSIIGFFVTRYINRTSKKQDENSKSIIDTHLQLTESINKLQLAISGLNGVILSMQQSNDTFTKGCSDKHTIINKRLDDHASRLNQHENKIVELDTKINMS